MTRKAPRNIGASDCVTYGLRTCVVRGGEGLRRRRCAYLGPKITVLISMSGLGPDYEAARRNVSSTLAPPRRGRCRCQPGRCGSRQSSGRWRVRGRCPRERVVKNGRKTVLARPRRNARAVVVDRARDSVRCGRIDLSVDDDDRRTPAASQASAALRSRLLKTCRSSTSSPSIAANSPVDRDVVPRWQLVPESSAARRAIALRSTGASDELLGPREVQKVGHHSRAPPPPAGCPRRTGRYCAGSASGSSSRRSRGSSRGRCGTRGRCRPSARRAARASPSAEAAPRARRRWSGRRTGR